jgi:hypothetical protein
VYQGYFLGGKGGRYVGLTTSPPSCADCLEISDPQIPVTLRACPDLYRDSFALYFFINEIDGKFYLHVFIYF